MKATTLTVEPLSKFKPVNLTLTFESQAELDAFGVLFNTSSFVALMKMLGADIRDLRIYNILSIKGANTDVTSTNIIPANITCSIC